MGGSAQLLGNLGKGTLLFTTQLPYLHLRLGEWRADFFSFLIRYWLFQLYILAEDLFKLRNGTLHFAIDGGGTAPGKPGDGFVLKAVG